jgi:hypothetical protein
MYIPVVAAEYGPSASSSYGQAVPQNWYQSPAYKKTNKYSSNNSEEERA